MDEIDLATLSDGTVVANMRNDHANPCDCRAYATSTDNGETWSDIRFDPVGPACLFAW